jgi:hypothetical protein
VVCCRFEKVEALGTAVLGKTPGATDVKDKMKKLSDDEHAIDDMYQKRLKDLQDAYDLQVRLSTCNIGFVNYTCAEL